MRVWVAALTLWAAPAWAQAPTDGKASVDDYVGSFVDGYVSNLKGGDHGKSSFRSIIAGVIARGIKPEDRDVFIELASGAPVVVTAPDKVINVPALDGEVLMIAQLFAAPPNLNLLWKQPGEPTLVLIEISRWGKAAKARVVGFMANKLYATWGPSTTMNSYSPWVQEFAGINNSLDLIADPVVKTEGKLLLKAAMEEVFAKCKADGRSLPQFFLYSVAFNQVGQPLEPQ